MKTKTEYICEKCGASFDNYDEAARCERMHVEINYPVVSKTSYSRGEALPSRITIKIGTEYDATPNNQFALIYSLVGENETLTDEWRRELAEKRKAVVDQVNAQAEAGMPTAQPYFDELKEAGHVTLAIEDSKIETMYAMRKLLDGNGVTAYLDTVRYSDGSIAYRYTVAK